MSSKDKIGLVALVVIAALAGCDPAKGKTKAETSAAVQVGPSHASAVQLPIDPATSKIAWTGAKVTAKHDGGFRSFRGTIAFAESALEKSSVTVEIDADSLFTDSDRLAKHLKSRDFFDVASFPKAAFASTKIAPRAGTGSTHDVTGNLTLHGVTKSITFPATIRAANAGVEVDAAFSINRKEFGLVYAGKADDLIRDDVVIKLTVRSQAKS